MQKTEYEDKEDVNLRLFKEKWLFIMVLASIPIAIALCIVFIVLNPDSSYAGIAMNGAIGLVMALAGYYVRGDR